MQFWLFKNQRGISLGQETGHDKRQSLAYADPDMSQVMSFSGVWDIHGQLVTGLAHVMALHGVSHAKIVKPISDGLAKWTGRQHLLDFVIFKCMAGYILDHSVPVQIQHRGSVLSAQANVSEI